MIFEKEILSFHLLDVLELKQRNIHMFNSGRNFSALSFRFHADTFLKTETEEFHVKDNWVAYIPARLDYGRVSDIDELIVIHFDTINYSTRNIECFLPKEPAALSKWFVQILECWNKKELGYKHQCSAILYKIFAECYAQNFDLKPKNAKIKNSIEYIAEHYKNSDLSIREVAQASFISEVYFRKLFKEEYGITPQQYIINLRIQNAAGLIATGYYSLKEVAFLSGYTDYKYFSVEFKKCMGVSPSEYYYNYGQ